MKYINGNDMLLYEDVTPIGASKECKARVEADIIETSHPESGAWKTYITKRKGWNMANTMIATPHSIEQWTAKVGHTIFVQFRSRDNQDCLCGYAIVKSADFMARRGALSVINISLQGTGPLSNQLPRKYLYTSNSEQFNTNTNQPVEVIA